MSIAVKSTPLVCHGHTRPVPSIHFSALLPPSPSAPADPNYLLISACKDGKPMLRDWVGDWQGTFTDKTVGHKGAVWEARLSGRDASLAATASADFSAKIWDTTTGACLLTLPHQHIVRTVDFSSTSSLSSLAQTKLLTGGHEKKVRLWDLARLEQCHLEGQEVGFDVCEELRDPATEKGTSHEGVVKKVLWDEERQCCITMGEDKLIKWWDLRTLSKVFELAMPNGDSITSMEKSLDSSLLCITHGHSVTFLDLATRTPRISHDLTYPPSSVSLHPFDQKTFVTGSSSDEWVRLHSLSTGEELEVGKGHHGPVHQVIFSPDGELYASGSEDGTVRLWQTTPKNYGLWRVNDEEA